MTSTASRISSERIAKRASKRKKRENVLNNPRTTVRKSMVCGERKRRDAQL
jgi:hypothetical protein